MNKTVISLVIVALSLPASGQVVPGETFKQVFVRVASDPDCKQSEYADFFLFTCEKEMALWYFTKPNHAAFPGVIKRSIIQQGNDSYAQEEGQSFASDAAQPAFKAWLDQIADLDRQASEWLKAHPGTPQSTVRPYAPSP